MQRWRGFHSDSSIFQQQKLVVSVTCCYAEEGDLFSFNASKEPEFLTSIAICISPKNKKLSYNDKTVLR